MDDVRFKVKKLIGGEEMLSFIDHDFSGYYGVSGTSNLYRFLDAVRETELFISLEFESKNIINQDYINKDRGGIISTSTLLSLAFVHMTDKSNSEKYIEKNFSNILLFMMSLDPDTLYFTKADCRTYILFKKWWVAKLFTFILNANLKRTFERES